MSANASGEARPAKADGLVARVGPEPIDPGRWYRRAVSPEQGAGAQFCRIVYNHHPGDAGLSLEYDACSGTAESVIHGS